MTWFRANHSRVFLRLGASRSHGVGGHATQIAEPLKGGFNQAFASASLETSQRTALAVPPDAPISRLKILGIAKGQMQLAIGKPPALVGEFELI